MIIDDARRAEGSNSKEDRAIVTLKQRAYVELKGQILSGRLSPGAVLSERRLATELKMSKTPVHAALERLEADGLVAVAAQQGIVVKAISSQDMADHFEIREAIEPFVVARLAGKLTPEQVRRVEGNLIENRRAVLKADVEANVKLDAEFHLTLCESLGNGEITQFMSRIREKVHSAIYRISSRQPERMAGSLAEHQGIADAIIAGDGTIAAERMKAHLRFGLQCAYDRHS